MTELQTAVLLIGESEKNLSGYAHELREFRVRVEKNSENAFNDISEVKFVVFELSKSSFAGDLELIRRLARAKSSHLSWIFVGELDSNAFQTVVKQLQSQEIRRWRYLKSPLLAKELPLHIHSLSEEEIFMDRTHREHDFMEVRRILGEVAHEFANLLMRVMSRADLALTEKDPVKARVHIEKLNDTCVAAQSFVAKIRKVSQESISHASHSRTSHSRTSTKLSSCIHEAVRSIGTSAEQKNVRIELDLCADDDMALDATLMSSSLSDLMGWMVEITNEGGKIGVHTQLHVKKGEPGIILALFCDGEEVSASTVKQALRFGSDLRLPTARQVARMHGGSLDFLPASRPEVLIWLPARLCEKT